MAGGTNDNSFMHTDWWCRLVREWELEAKIVPLVKLVNLLEREVCSTSNKIEEGTDDTQR